MRLEDVDVNALAGRERRVAAITMAMWIRLFPVLVVWVVASTVWFDGTGEVVALVGGVLVALLVAFTAARVTRISLAGGMVTVRNLVRTHRIDASDITSIDQAFVRNSKGLVRDEITLRNGDVIAVDASIR